QWSGIIIVGQQWSDPSRDPRGGRDFTVRNSVIHDVGGDGLLLTTLKHGLIENNVAWNTGMQPTETIGTPDGIWAWMCEDCIVQDNEGYFTDSPGVDGGVFDIDYGNINNVVQYNYAHDSQGYCASVFGSAGPVGNSVNSEIRYNLCVNNGRSPRLAKRQGAIYISTWNNGYLDGVKIHHNTIYWNPPGKFAALVSDAKATGTRTNIFEDNLLVSTVPDLIAPNGFIKLDRNLYWYTGAGQPSWTYDGRTYLGWTEYQKGSGEDAHSIYADPMLTQDFHLQPGSPGTWAKDSGQECARDVFGTALSRNSCTTGAAGIATEIKDNQHDDLDSEELHPDHGKWSLISFLDIDNSGAENLSRSEVVVLESMLNQYASKGLKVIAIVDASAPDSFENR